MPSRFAGSVIALEAAALGATPLDFDLSHGEVAIIRVDDEEDAAALVDLCTGLALPASGHVRFLGVDWRTRTPRERLQRRRRIGAVVQTEVWPSHMTIMDSILLPRLYHVDRPPDEAVADGTALARLFGLPGLPTDHREAMPTQALVRAACVRGFIGAPELVMVQDEFLDHMPELAVPMAQAIGATRQRGGAVLWVSCATVSQAAAFIEPDQVLRLGERGLVQTRRTW